MKTFIAAVVAANQEIASLLKKRDASLFEMLEVGVGGDVSSRADIEAERIFVEHLRSFGKINSEESGVIGEGDDEIIIDPLDGSSNYFSNLPYYGTSVSLSRGDKVRCAIICNIENGDVFIKDEKSFTKVSLFHDNQQPVEKNPHAVLGIFERAYQSVSITGRLRNAGIKYRSMGAMALSLAYAHDVDFVLYEGDVRIYDVSAGFYMCEDLHTMFGENYFFIAKDKETYDKILKILEPTKGS